MIYTNSMCYSVAKLLADTIEEFTGVHLLVSTLNHRTKNLVHIRYGGVEPTISKEPVLNSSSFIRLCSNKKTLSDLLIANNIRTVTFSPKTQYTPDMGAVLVRSTLSGFGGAGITVCINQEEVNRAEGYWMSPFIKFSSEYRAHLFNGEIIRIQKKVNTGEKEMFPIRNHTRGYFFSVRSTRQEGLENFPQLVEFVNTILPLFPEKHFCGLDLGYNKINGFYVIENNSAPGLEESTLMLYAKMFCEELGFSIRKEGVDSLILPSSTENT